MPTPLLGTDIPNVFGAPQLINLADLPNVPALTDLITLPDFKSLAGIRNLQLPNLADIGDALKSRIKIIRH